MEFWSDPLFWAAVTAGVAVGGLAGRWSAGSGTGGGDVESRDKIRILKDACRLSRDAVLILDHKLEIIFANPAAERLGEFSVPGPLSAAESVLEFYLRDEGRWMGAEGLVQRHRLRKGSEGTHYKELLLGREKQIQVSVEIRSVAPSDTERGFRYHVLTIHDESCEKKLFDLHHLNTLSGLPNKFKAYGEITAITSRGNDRDRFAVMTVELDDASKLRSMLGYNEMESIITHTANALRELAAENERISVFHLNYVTFMILMRQPRNMDEIYGLFEKFQLGVRERYNLQLNKQKITFSAGVSLYPQSRSLYGLIDGAFIALTQAQEEGKGRLLFNSKEMDRRIDYEILINTDIEKGLLRRDFKLHFQPIFAYRGGERYLEGAEALLRWEHPEKGQVSPAVFIPIAEKSGLILEIGKYVMEESLKQLSRWHSFGFPPLQLSVNLSLRELENQDFLTHLVKTLSRYEIGDSRLKFEITEYATTLNPVQAKRTLEEIRQLGIGISLDDFGTGYSSFAHLAEFPIETLKIDRSFVTNMLKDPGKRHIVSTMTKLGHSLGMNIVAEGVESRQEADLLAQMGVDYLQGFYFSKPLPQLEFQYLLSHS